MLLLTGNKLRDSIGAMHSTLHHKCRFNGVVAVWTYVSLRLFKFAMSERFYI